MRFCRHERNSTMIDRYRPPRPYELALATACAAVTLLPLGCQRFQSSHVYPAPTGYTGATSSAPTGDAAGASLSQHASQNAAMRPVVPPEATARRTSGAAGIERQPPRTIIRGQGGNFAIPPAFRSTDGGQAADGGRHSRNPLPVGGQRAATVAQNPQNAPSTARRSGGTSAQPVAQSQYTSPPGDVPQQGQAYAPQQGQAPPPAGAAYPAQPGYDVLPEIAGEDLAPGIGQPLPYTPLTRTADIIVNGYPARTGRIMFGGAVNSDAGVTGQITVEERNFDITRFPRSFQDLVSGTAFRGAGQTFRLEAVPGSRFKRYSVNFTEPYMFGYLPISMSVSGFLFDRRYQDWDEERLGGRLSFGYRITPDLSISAGIRGENVKVSNPRVSGVPELDDVLGDNDLYSGQLRLTHDTRNNPFAPSEGHYLEMTYEQAFGDYEYPRGELALSKYFLVRERADGSGKQTLTTAWSLGFSGEDTPIFENFFAGGYSTLRGFEFRGASPTVNGVQVGGRFQFLGTLEYMFPLTADDMLRGVAFVDYGTVEQNIAMHSDNFRVAPGLGLRVAVPALGPAPLAFDFAFPIEEAATDEKQTFSFYMGLNRRF